jgi:cysteinyl-tRNA synthetase
MKQMVSVSSLDLDCYNWSSHDGSNSERIKLSRIIALLFYVLNCLQLFNITADGFSHRQIFPRQRDNSQPILSFAVSESTLQKSNNREIQFYNSLSRAKDIFKTIHPGKVSMYTCGPTIYDSAHVGNFRAFLTYDLVKRVLTYFGYNVDHICNLTDVDDKIIKRCNDLNVSLQDLTAKYEALFMDDLKALNIIPARAYPRATNHINEMVQLVVDLEANGLAYQSAEGSWYFNVAKKQGYGEQLISLEMEDTQGGVLATGYQRIGMDADEYDADKVGVRDFALWKAFKPSFDRDDATWDTAIGRGRPGWHLECSAMAKKFLGDEIDIHCGGIDLKFPHHENEIAQSEVRRSLFENLVHFLSLVFSLIVSLRLFLPLTSEQGASGKKFCNCWLHNGFVNIGDEKMSKSKGNFLTLREACPTLDDIRAFRYLVISSHYRNPLSFTEQALSAAKAALKRIDRLRRQLDMILQPANTSGEVAVGGEGIMAKEVEKHIENFNQAISDDLSMPRAAASLFGVVKVAETELKRAAAQSPENEHHTADTAMQRVDIEGVRLAQHALDLMDQVFGIFYEIPAIGTDTKIGSIQDVIPEEVMQLVDQRASAKEAKDWKMADSLRDQILQLGYAIKDVKGGEPVVSRLDN